MTGVPAPVGLTGDERLAPHAAAVWRLRGGPGRPPVNVHLDHARPPLKVGRDHIPAAPCRVGVTLARHDRFTDPDHLETLGRALIAAAEWLRATPITEAGPDPQLTLDDLLEAQSG